MRSTVIDARDSRAQWRLSARLPSGRDQKAEYGLGAAASAVFRNVDDVYIASTMPAAPVPRTCSSAKAPVQRAGTIELLRGCGLPRLPRPAHRLRGFMPLERVFAVRFGINTTPARVTNIACTIARYSATWNARLKGCIGQE